MNIITENYDYVAGVDTHAGKHIIVVLDKLGIESGAHFEVRVTETQMESIVLRLQRDFGNKIIFAVEGTSSYGETFCHIIKKHNFDVIEVKPPKVKQRGQNGKTDVLDAKAAALTALRTPIDKVIIPRSGTRRNALRVLLSGRKIMTSQQTKCKNALIALLRCNDLGIDVRNGISTTSIEKVSKWRINQALSDTEIVRYEAKRLAKEYADFADDLVKNRELILSIVEKIVPDMLFEKGFGPISLAQMLCAYSHKGRIRSEAAFAKLAGVAPIPASSGKTSRYRLSRLGDRGLNRSFTVVVRTKMRCDDETIEYTARRTAEGKSRREIERCLKRFVVRYVYREFEKLNISL